MQNSEPYNNDLSQNDSEISLNEIIGFFDDNWKKLALGGVLGALLGLSTWFILGYKAELVITNNNAIDFVSWRTLSKNLPILASDLVERGRLPNSEIAFYKKLSDPMWWNKNVLPTYTISKSDAKELAGISKELQDTAGTSITYLVINHYSFDKQEALDNVEKTNDFIRKACTYLTIKEMLNGYESEALALDADVQKKITTAEVELQYLSKKAANLEELRQRFPANVGANIQNIIDPKDAAAKYLPISTLLVAVNTDIFITKESLERLSDSLMRNLIIKQFVAQTRPLLDSGNRDGLLLVDNLIKAQEDIRSKIQPNDIKNIKTANEIHASLISTKTRFSKFLESFLAPTAVRPSLSPSLIIGFFAGLFISLLAILGIKFWNIYRSNKS